ncbi:dienelactone hydrolase family protein [Rhizobium sp. SG2393]|uniref:dienelactone hydrolase family protein n=1 Tax=Rhizobium sp. SG2393 TaxID=3276279 RepID=UPI00367311F9
MSTVHFISAAARRALCPAACRLLALLAGLALALPASAELLKPFKDDLFAYNPVTETADGGARLTVGYDEMRDINGRDEIPERRVKRAYVDLGIKREQAMESVMTTRGAIDVARTGPAEGGAFSVVFIHGRGGDRRLGANDFSFGGNFNRIKNLAVANGGTYYSASMKGFDQAGAADLSALVVALSARTAGRPVYVACASMGSFLCWGIARDPATVKALGGMIVMGGPADPDYRTSAAYKARLPLYLTHGGRDSVYPASAQQAVYEALHKAGYPVRFVLFTDGSHGTPVRMTDWRAAINFLASAR